MNPQFRLDHALCRVVLFFSIFTLQISVSLLYTECHVKTSTINASRCVGYHLPIFRSAGFMAQGNSCAHRARHCFHYAETSSRTATKLGYY